MNNTIISRRNKSIGKRKTKRNITVGKTTIHKPPKRISQRYPMREVVLIFSKLSILSLFLLNIFNANVNAIAIALISIIHYLFFLYLKAMFIIHLKRSFYLLTFY